MHRRRDRTGVLLGDHHPLRTGGEAAVTYTPVKQAQWDRSAKAHHAAETQFYPGMWPGAVIRYTDLTGTNADTRGGSDYIAEVGVPGWKAPVKFWIQERWRDPSFYWTYRDATVTSWNRNSGMP